MNEVDFARAVGRYLENALSPAEERELQKAVESDPALRAAFISHVRLSVRLEASHHDPHDARLVERTKALLGAKDQGQSLRTLGEVQRTIRGRARARFWAGWGVAAASVVLAALGVAFWPGRARPSGPTPEIGVRSVPLPPAPPKPEPPPLLAPPDVAKEKPEAVAPTERRAPDPVVPPAPKPIAPDRSAPNPPPKIRPEPPAPKPPVETKTAAARIESLSGDAFLSTPAGRKPLRPGQDLAPGEGVQTAGATSAVVIAFPDHTRLELGPNTIVRAIFDHEPPAPGAPGKRLILDKGRLRAQVARQPADQGMEVRTPHAEAHVLGTTLRLLVGDAKEGSTRLEVSEGKVQFKRPADAKAVEVAAGHYAVAAANADLVAYADPIVIDLNEFGTARGAKPAEGAVRRLYPDVSLAATGGTCVAAPGVGTSLEGALSLAPGAWRLWIRYRDTELGPVSFQVGIDGRLADTIVGEGFLKKQGLDKKWNWRGIDFESKAKTTRLTLRSTSDALRFDKGENTYGVVNRWDSILLTRDPNFDPEE